MNAPKNTSKYNNTKCVFHEFKIIGVALGAMFNLFHANMLLFIQYSLWNSFN